MTSADSSLAERLFVVRAGKQDEVLDLFLDGNIVGVGWDKLGDIGGLDDAGLRDAIDEHYPDTSAGSRRAWLAALTSFKAIQPGDRVIVPITSQRLFAVGTVSGTYDYDAGRPPLAVHAFAVRWIDRAVPRELLGQLKNKVDRQPTVHRIVRPDAVELVDQMLESREPIVIPTDPADAVVSARLEAVLTSIADDDDAEIRASVELAARALETRLGPPLLTKGRSGMGPRADVPWISVTLPGASATAQEGVYPVFLFAADGARVYLTFIHGTENLKAAGGKLEHVLQKRVLDMRTAAGIADAGADVELASLADRPRNYARGSAFAIEYQRGEIPPDYEIEADVREVVAYAEKAMAAGLSFDPVREPCHLLFKWSREFEPQTVERHRALAEQLGSVWWGKFGSGQMSKTRVAALQAQLDDGVLTHAYLYGDKTLTRTRLVALTADPDEVADGDIPDYYEKAECSLFVRLTDFEELPSGWALEHLLLASNPEPSAVRGALSNQTTPLFLYERFAPAEESMPSTNLSWEWLEQVTLWEKSELEEVLAALDPKTGKGQVILAGPPGTGKTWVAKSIARYLTNDAPLRHEVVQFHPSYGYEEFVEGIRPIASDSGAIEFAPVKGTLLRLCEAIGDSEDEYVLIIDELNRANIPRVFGELLYLLEYRDEPINLQYSSDFRLPSNLRIIATMNTADRSVRSIDAALRRRFEVFDCPADGTILRRYQEQPGNAPDITGSAEGFDKLNAELSEALDRHHTIGQSFFMRPGLDARHLSRTWSRQILPLIEDYFFDQPDVVAEFTLAKFWPDI